MTSPDDEIPPRRKPRGRGAPQNLPNRFERTTLGELPIEARDDLDPSLEPAPRTRFERDMSRSILTRNDSPDVGFEFSVNPYRGCEHGCAYCYARPTHEYLGLSAGLDFESRIFVKEGAPALLREGLLSKSWTPAVIAMSGITDCYQPAQRRVQVTRRCLEVCAEFMNPVSIITKNHLVTRDIDVLSRLAAEGAA